jgi:hypothetical protein
MDGNGFFLMSYDFMDYYILKYFNLKTTRNKRYKSF